VPHLIIEYSANLERAIDIPRLVAAVHAAALETGVFPIGGIRTRAERRDAYAVADSHPDNAFIHVQARIGVGGRRGCGPRPRAHLRRREAGPQRRSPAAGLTSRS
jgi:5-carboxymethyl-2-hydroxymuconate isomerase